MAGKCPHCWEPLTPIGLPRERDDRRGLDLWESLSDHPVLLPAAAAAIAAGAFKVLSALF